MSTYRLLRDHWIGQNYFLAGSTQKTSDVGGLLPAGWVPSDAVEAMDAAAVAAVYAAGPKKPSISTLVSAPQTYWFGVAAGAVTKWQLTGLGANTSPIYV